MNRFQDLEVFIRVVESGSFAKTAAELELSPSIVSRRVSRLEEQLGVRLFDRTTRNLCLTEVGERYFNRCLSILASLEEADHEAKQHAEEPQGSLRISCSTLFADRYILRLIPEFLAQYPRLSIQLTLTDDVVDLIANGIDIALRISELTDASLVAQRLVADRRIICASPRYLDRYGIPRTPDDLAQHNCLSLAASKTTLNRWRFRDRTGVREITVQGNFSVNTGEALYEAVLAGLGVARVSEFLASQAMRSGQLVRLLTHYEDQNETGVYAVFLSNRYLLPKVRCFIDFLVDHFSEAYSSIVDDPLSGLLRIEN
jgi:DNA-binding transcriptional LysR family regulator